MLGIPNRQVVTGQHNDLACYTSLPGRLVRTDPNSTFPGRFQPRRNHCVKTMHSQMSTTPCSQPFIQLIELGRRGESENDQGSKQSRTQAPSNDSHVFYYRCATTYSTWLSDKWSYDKHAQIHFQKEKHSTWFVCRLPTVPE